MSSGQQTGFIYAKSILFYLSTFAFVILIKMHQNASIYTVLCANINCIFSKFFHWVFTNALTFSLKPIHQEKRGFGILLTALCILLRYKECRQRSEHINPKIATFGTFLNILFHKSTLKLRALKGKMILEQLSRTRFLTESAQSFMVLFLWKKTFKKVPKVAVLRFICSDL